MAIVRAFPDVQQDEVAIRGEATRQRLNRILQRQLYNQAAAGQQLIVRLATAESVNGRASTDNTWDQIGAAASTQMIITDETSTPIIITMKLLFQVRGTWGNSPVPFISGQAWFLNEHGTSRSITLHGQPVTLTASTVTQAIILMGMGALGPGTWTPRMRINIKLGSTPAATKFAQVQIDTFMHLNLQELAMVRTSPTPLNGAS